jgi:hypothetical protein
VINIVMQQVTVNVGQTPDGKAKVIEFVDPQSHITVTVPLDLDAARRIGTQLASTLLVASGPLGAKLP